MPTVQMRGRDVGNEELTAIRIGAGIRTARVRRRMTQTELATRVGITFQTIIRMERGSPGTSMGHYMKALWVLGLLDTMAAVADPARDAVNGIFEYEYNESADQAPKLASLEIIHRQHGERVLWSSAPGVNFVGAAHVDLSVRETRDGKAFTSSTSIQEHVLKTYNLQTIDSIERGPARAITIRGQIGSEIIDGSLEASAVDYSLVFYFS